MKSWERAPGPVVHYTILNNLVKDIIFVHEALDQLGNIRSRTQQENRGGGSKADYKFMNLG